MKRRTKLWNIYGAARNIWNGVAFTFDPATELPEDAHKAGYELGYTHGKAVGYDEGLVNFKPDSASPEKITKKGQ